MDPRLVFADELAERDETAAAALAEVEALQREVEEARAHAAAGASFFAELPATRAAREHAVRVATERREGAAAALARAEQEAARADERRREQERLAAARAVEQARAALEDAGHELDRAAASREALDQEEERWRRDEERLAQRAAGLHERLVAVPRLAHDAAPPPAADLAAILDWASHERGALLLARSALAGERDAIVREANELAAAVLGETIAATSVAGVRERVRRALDS